MKQHPVWNVLAHATIIGSGMFIIFFLIDRVNPAMDFLGSPLSKWCLFLYCLLSLFSALCAAVYLFRRNRKAEAKAQARAMQRYPSADSSGRDSRDWRRG